MMLRLRNERELNKHGLAIDTSDPSRVVPIGQLAEHQQARNAGVDFRRSEESVARDLPRACQGGAARRIGAPQSACSVVLATIRGEANSRTTRGVNHE